MQMLPLAPMGLTLEQAAAYCGIPETTFRALVEAGQMPQPLELSKLDRWHREHVRKAFAKIKSRSHRDVI